ncbi:hypothetical protein ABW20_dc0104634 [Dactylellina cionopaga]|nr:hypothetical protein ABW20_dc0104634 [Dactylellina cionopaga]
MNDKYLTPTMLNDPVGTLLVLTDMPDRSFYWVPNSANPVPPGGQFAQGTLLYEVKSDIGAYNLTLGLAPFNPDNDLYTPVVLRSEFNTSTSYAHAAAHDVSGVVFLNDLDHFIGCSSFDVPTHGFYTLEWQINFEQQGLVDHRCAQLIISISN